MSTISRAATESASGDSFSKVLRWFAGRPRAIAVYWDRRAAIKSLEELDDGALRDIGLLRCHIEAAVKGDLRRRPG